MALKYINGVIGAPEAVGPYSQAVITDNLVYLSGQIPLDSSGKLIEGNVEEQCEQVMKNIIAVLGHMQMDFSHVIKATVFLTDLKDFHSMNRVYSKWLCGCRPARSTIQVAALPLGAKIEIEVVAALRLKDAPMLDQGHIKDLEKLSERSGVTCSENR